MSSLRVNVMDTSLLISFFWNCVFEDCAEAIQFYACLADIAISQPCSCFRNNVLAFRSETYFHNKIVIRNGKGLGLASTFAWRNFCIKENLGKKFNLGRAKLWRGRLMINAVATLETTSVTHKNEGVKGSENVSRMDVDSVRSNSPDSEPQSSSEDSMEVDEREKLRRMRISKANKGNTPWNKGKKHSPETLRRIKERTKLAMQDPKVKMKLVNLGHAQSEETKIKIGVGVRLGWEKRREKLKLQETCHYEWQNLIAVAARQGLFGEEELQWDSHKILSKQLEQEWIQSVELRKSMVRPKGSKRAPKSAEQKRKISEAIAAKWADPGYRDRVCSGLAKFHGITERVERKPRRKPSGDGQTRKRRPKKKDEKNDLAKGDTKSQIQRTRTKRRTPLYKDPLASSKLEMLKNIRAQRAAAINQKSEAINRAKLMIAEAEKASEALEIAAKNSPIAQASLTESRKLIAEAIQVIESIENEDTISLENDDDLSENSAEPVLSHDEEEMDAKSRNLDIKVNGVHSLFVSDDIETDDFSLDEFLLPNLVNGNASSSHYTDSEENLHRTSSNGFLSYNTEDTSNFQTNLSDHDRNHAAISMDGLSFESENGSASTKQVKIIKKWVHGKLIEVAEETLVRTYGDGIRDWKLRTMDGGAVAGFSHHPPPLVVQGHGGSAVLSA
ncbi:hypothetical protein BUALT_Bualt07G0171200 [Buddleja alternifolia]|uniref:Nuclease associated modular domain-containing protein n=1 Tax=Buddleja alternifolia TaxID=168488 RepID=A0AAV6XFS6_9LAMI|nr:hypothetical protein BUALT_Bualt07G0171200 [Buddleja alternifolia]